MSFPLNSPDAVMIADGDIDLAATVLADAEFPIPALHPSNQVRSSEKSRHEFQCHDAAMGKGL